MIVYHFHVFSATVPGNLSHLVGLLFIPRFALCYHILTPLLLPLCKQYSLGNTAQFPPCGLSTAPTAA
ncbi:hypothetical protein, partial [Gemmiger sp.]|uniref:hypothetical protein n=1 Tax=Gemmiger sp. TaxID=2049027 RepID=UPI0025C406C5